RAAAGRRGPPDGSNPRHAGRTSALPTPTADRRAGLRKHQVPPPHRPFPTTRLTRLPGRMEADRLHPQPAQALARQRTPGRRLSSGAPNISRTVRLTETKAATERLIRSTAEPLRRLCATASNRDLSLSVRTDARGFCGIRTRSVVEARPERV